MTHETSGAQMTRILNGFAMIAGLAVLLVITLAVLKGGGELSRLIGAAPEPTMFATPTLAVTETPTPTATVDYQQTAIVAQTTSDAAVVAMVNVTAEHEARLHEALAWTQQADAITATAALTNIPLTATAQEITATAQANKDIALATQQSIITTQIAMTLTAPTQIVAMHNAEMQNYYAPVGEWMKLGMMGSFCVMLIMVGMGAMMKREAHQPAPQPIAQPAQLTQPKQIAMTIKRETSPVSQSWNKTIIPCSAHMLIELADGLINNGKTLAVNQWEGNDTLWNRAAFSKMRAFLISNHFAQAAGGTLALTATGEGFLREFLTSGALPHSIEWSETLAPKVTSMAHAHEAHAHEREAGEGLEDYEPLPA